MSQPIFSAVHCDTSNSQCDVIPFDAARESLAASSVVCFLRVGDRIAPIDVPPDLLKARLAHAGAPMELLVPKLNMGAADSAAPRQLDADAIAWLREMNDFDRF